MQMHRSIRGVLETAIHMAPMALAVSLAAGCGESGAASDPSAGGSVSRGGRLYDTWWTVKGSAEPAGANPGYALTQGTQTGAGTWRCKECHGWDYKGVAGAYGAGSHFTGVAGLVGAGQLHSQGELVAMIRDGVAGEAMTAFGSHLSQADLSDLARFVREGMVDLTPYMASVTGAPIGADPVRGKTLYDATCLRCHGADGSRLNFGTALAPEYVGHVANENPWEFQHKVRFGQPGEDMPSAVDSGWTMQDVMDVLSHARTLPAP
jgi:mono/diheme cytochrome c family protein